MSIKFFIINIILITSLFCSQSLSAKPFASPEEAVSAYITAVKTGSGKHIEMAFLSSASIQYYNEVGEFKNYTRDEFAKLVDSGNEWNAKIEISDIKITKYAANATVDFTWGEDGKKGYVDYLNLIYSDGSWYISDKVAQFVDR